MKKVYVAATRQNDGKTITCIGLISAFKKRVPNVGYIKPVGQRYLDIDGHRVDEDSLLIKQVYDLKGDIQDMSPIAVPRGFTEAYIENPNRAELIDSITGAFERISSGIDIMLVEGTGHAGVGSVFDMSNGDVAKLLGTKVILVSSGGIGRPIDEIMLNKALFDQQGVEIIGVIVNKVQAEKYDKVNKMVRKGLVRKGMEVLGVMPYRPVLSSPTIEQLMHDINGELLSGKAGLRNVAGRMVIGAMPPHEALNYFSKDALLITPGTREDLILAAMSSCVVGIGRHHCVSGIILTGGTAPHHNVMDLIKRTWLPVILVEEDTFTVATKIDRLIVKIRAEDRDKIQATENLVEEFIDIKRLLELLS
ncbi:MAG TPA: AAA family ATPase [Armatimonadota bacterium]|nr:AAA family ATPase [Armatimonadota bacterium]HPP73556.1 AAA family ATPase [Armatimonadota bacterium]